MSTVGTIVDPNPSQSRIIGTQSEQASHFPFTFLRGPNFFYARSRKGEAPEGGLEVERKRKRGKEKRGKKKETVESNRSKWTRMAEEIRKNHPNKVKFLAKEQKEGSVKDPDVVYIVMLHVLLSSRHLETHMLCS